MILRPHRINQLLCRLLPGHDPDARPHMYAIDYRGGPDDPPMEKTWLHRGFFVRNLPRLMLRCRMWGHRPVVDGIPARRTGSYVSQPYLWVVCARCGTKPDPHGSLDPYAWRIGQPYNGPWEHPATTAAYSRPPRVPAPRQPSPERPLLYPPGLFARRPTGGLGVELVVGGKGWMGVGWDIKIGTAGSEHTLAGTVRLGPLLYLHIHTSRFGTGLTRILNRGAAGDLPVSRLVGVYLRRWRLGWYLWAPRAGAGIGQNTPRWWQHTEIDLRLDNRLLGAKQLHRTEISERLRGTVRLPDGDYPVKMQLFRVEYRRPRRKRPGKITWLVQWSCRTGIPTRESDLADPPGPCGSSVPVTEAAARQGTWTAEAPAAIAMQISGWRTQHQWQPEPGEHPTGREITR